jgi:hypothetical protein
MSVLRTQELYRAGTYREVLIIATNKKLSNTKLPVES